MSMPDGVNASARTISPLPARLAPRPGIIFTDVDDTLTCDGLLPAETFNALYELQNAGVEVIPVTGASAGWCDCLIKTWPINTVIGENGALTMSKNQRGIVTTHLVKNADNVARDMARLKQIATELSARHPEIQYTQDQKFRLSDIAFDIGQAVMVDAAVSERATQWLIDQGVQARRSSIHINVWIGDHSKATGALQLLNGRNIAVGDCLFIGDSPNDEAMFKHFPLSVGVSNVEKFLSKMQHAPVYITQREGGFGFVEMTHAILNGSHQPH